jgi:transposase
VASARKKYTEEYKAEAVEFVISSGRQIAEVARNLGINKGTLANWVNKAKKNSTVQEKPLDVAERAEPEELRKELQRVKMERDFLKTAAAWFASHISKVLLHRGTNEENTGKPRGERFPVSLYVRGS